MLYSKSLLLIYFIYSSLKDSQNIFLPTLIPLRWFFIPFFLAHWVFDAATRSFVWLQREGVTPSGCGSRASRCGGFSCCGAQALGARASGVAALRHSACGTRDLLGTGIEPESPALAGGFFTE